MVKELVNFDLLNDVDDIFTLRDHAEELSDIPGWGDRSIQKCEDSPFFFALKLAAF